MVDRSRSTRWLAALTLLFGCGGAAGSSGAGGSTGGAGGTSGEASCARGSVPGPDGACMAVGVQGCAEMLWGEDGLCHPTIDACPKGSVVKLDEGCVRVGLPGCPAEFLQEDDMCRPSMTSCGPGSFPIPDEGCAPLDGPSGCGEGTWGDIVEAPADLHVDGAALPGGDGSRAAPFATIADAMALVLPGGRVVLAAGEYAEPVWIDEDIELVGRCPSMVTVYGIQLDLNGVPAVVVVRNTDAAAIRGVRITGDGSGVVAYFAKVALERVHVDEAMYFGIVADGTSAEVTLARSVVERTRPGPEGEFGIGVDILSRAKMKIESSAIMGNRGAGVLLDHPSSVLDLSRSTVSGTTFGSGPERGGNGLAVSGGTAHIAGVAFTGNLGPQLIARGEGAIIDARDSLFSAGPEVGPPMASGDVVPAGRGVDLADGATGTFLRCAMRLNYEAAIIAFTAGTDVTIDTCFAGDTEPGFEYGGHGVQCDFGATVHVRDSTFARNSEAGLAALVGDATIEAERTLVEATRPGKAGYFGFGVTGRSGGHLILTNSALVANGEIGGFLSGGVTASLTNSLVEGTLPSVLDGSVGIGLVADGASTLDLTSSAILHNHTAAVAFTGSGGLIKGSLLADVPDGKFTLLFPEHTYEGVGDGLLVLRGSDVSVEGSVIQRCSRAGILFDASAGAVSKTWVTANQFGLVLQSDAKPTLSEDDRFEDNTEQDVVEGGALPVPDAPSEVPPLP